MCIHGLLNNRRKGARGAEKWLRLGLGGGVRYENGISRAVNRGCIGGLVVTAGPGRNRWRGWALGLRLGRLEVVDGYDGRRVLGEALNRILGRRHKAGDGDRLAVRLVGWSRRACLWSD